MIDGEIVALDEEGRPSFNALQNYGSARAPVMYFVFDIMVLAGRDVGARRSRRGARCWTEVLPKLAEPVRYTAHSMRASAS